MRLVPFANGAPTADHVTALRLGFSLFGDGSGWERNADGSTRIGWRQMERVIAEVLGVTGEENKGIFDILVTDTQVRSALGVSVKSKKRPEAIAVDPATGGRVYLEVANSPAKFWDYLGGFGLTRNDFAGRRRAGEIGPRVLELVENWHREGGAAFRAANPGWTFDLGSSVHLVASYALGPGHQERFQVHSFPLAFGAVDRWEFSSSRCLRGFDAQEPAAPLVDWYGLSGGQLKYYPRVADCLYHSPMFELLRPPAENNLDRARRYWPGNPFTI